MQDNVVYLINSLSKNKDKKELFEPEDRNNVKIYICGPTVYDSPHIGHARTYISFDILRRVLEEYFKYNMTLVMNITNIDDKIITRAQERNMEALELADIYEREFFDALDLFKIKRPNFITRVDQYVPHIIKYIEDLVEHKLAYEVNGSVYFDLNEYKKHRKYNLLRPETKKDETVLEGEVVNADLKKTDGDFVLWKASKAGEIKYDSPWGEGRPGWHIECSVMASSILGETLDIHAGGVDLAFPHHENEIAQCQAKHLCESNFKQEASENSNTWCKYFFHTGHLNIDGRKMLKSLKNFLTIKDILEVYEPETLRILFLQHTWNAPMNYDEDQLKRAETMRKKIFNFIYTVEGTLSAQKLAYKISRSSADGNTKTDSNSSSNNSLKYSRAATEKDLEIYDSYIKTKAAVDAHLRNNVNFSEAFLEINNLITVVNSNIEELSYDILNTVLEYVKRMFGIFGLSVHNKEGESTDNTEEGLVNVLNNFRSSVRTLAKSKADYKEFFAASDKVRDDLEQLGYKIDDKATGATVKKSI